jgi:hypothetical protein
MFAAADHQSMLDNGQSFVLVISKPRTVSVLYNAI